MNMFARLFEREIVAASPMWGEAVRKLVSDCHQYDALQARGAFTAAVDEDLERSMRVDMRSILVGYAMAQQKKVEAMKADAARRRHLKAQNVEPDGSSSANPRRDAGHHPG